MSKHSIESHELKVKAQMLAQHVKHYLITSVGKTIDEASKEEFYRALCSALREEIMVNWTATSHTFCKKRVRRVYYLSMEWLPGRMFMNNIANIGCIELVKEVMHLLGRNFQSILNTESDPGLGNGGLGRLAACFLDSLATLQYPAMGYGLRYQYGIFEQELWSGVQIERPDCWLLSEYPWELRRDYHAASVKFGGRMVSDFNKHNQEVHHLVDAEEVRALPYDIPIIGYDDGDDYAGLTLRLWTTKESPRNFQLARFNAGDLSAATEHTALTDVLYPNDNNDMGRMMRIKQEYLLVSASLQDIFKQYFLSYDNLSEFADKVRIQLNDTHPALAIPELMRILTKSHEVHWEEAWEITKTVCSYTNHTVLKEALEEWDASTISTLLPRQEHIIEKINWGFCSKVRDAYPNDEEKVRRMSIIENGVVRMAHLSIAGSHRVNGVAALHTEILKKHNFRDFHEFEPDKFINVTNGVTQRRWLLKCNHHLSEYITHLIGKEWITDLKHLEKFANFASDRKVQEQFLNIKHGNKLRLLKALCKHKKARYGDTIDLEKEFFLEGDAMFDVQIKRIHEYKRQLMNAIHAMMLYNDILENPDSRKIKRKILIAGKAAPGYDMAKHIIRLIYILGRKINHDPVVGEKLKIVFVENYNVSKAELIIPAADLSEQISTAGLEASGTGNMKLSMNGALTIGTEDGANVEMRQSVGDRWWPFKFGACSVENSEMAKNHTYAPHLIVEKNPKIHNALEMLRNGSLAENDIEHDVLCQIYDSLLGAQNPDRFFVINDLMDYYETQLRVEELYQSPHKWAEFAIHNIAKMGRFSSDESIRNYAENIWGIKPCPIDSDELGRIRREFHESDRCFIAQ